MKKVVVNGILFGFIGFLFLNFGCKEKKVEVKEELAVIQGPQVVKSSTGIDINYTITGQGDHALIFVHGWSCDQTYWEEQVAYFKDEYQVITLDLGGHGKSGKNKTEWTMEDFGSDVLDVIDEIEFKKLSVIGHSMGSVVALNVATRIKEQLHSVIFVDFFKDKPKPPPTQEQVVKRTASFKGNFVNSTKGFVRGMFLPTSDSTLVAKTVDHMASADPNIAVSAMMNMVMYDNNAGFETLISKGTNAHIINSDMRPTNKPYFDSLGIKTHTIEETGHFLMIEKPVDFNRLVKKIIQTQS